MAATIMCVKVSIGCLVSSVTAHMSIIMHDNVLYPKELQYNIY